MLIFFFVNISLNIIIRLIKKKCNITNINFIEIIISIKTSVRNFSFSIFFLFLNLNIDYFEYLTKIEHTKRES